MIQYTLHAVSHLTAKCKLRAKLMNFCIVRRIYFVKYSLFFIFCQINDSTDLYFVQPVCIFTLPNAWSITLCIVCHMSDTNFAPSPVSSAYLFVKIMFLSNTPCIALFQACALYFILFTTLCCLKLLQYNMFCLTRCKMQTTFFLKYALYFIFSIVLRIFVSIMIQYKCISSFQTYYYQMQTNFHVILFLFDEINFFFLSNTL